VWELRHICNHNDNNDHLYHNDNYNNINNDLMDVKVKVNHSDSITITINLLNTIRLLLLDISDCDSVGDNCNS